MTFPDAATGEQFPQHLCTGCFDEILRRYPEVSKELEDARRGGRPAEIKSLPRELIPEKFQAMMRKRRGA
jgi:hypothetical protein